MAIWYCVLQPISPQESGSLHGKLSVAVGTAAGHPQLLVVCTVSVQSGTKHDRHAVPVEVSLGQSAGAGLHVVVTEILVTVTETVSVLVVVVGIKTVLVVPPVGVRKVLLQTRPASSVLGMALKYPSDYD